MAKAECIKFFTVVGNARIGGGISNNHYSQVFKTRGKAAKLIAGEINDYIRQENLVRDMYTAADCKGGAIFYAHNDADDRLEFSIVEHTVPKDFFSR